MSFDSTGEGSFAAIEAFDCPDICIYGLGYIGLPTALVFADSGLRVHGVDVNPSVVESLREGRAHLKEEGLGSRLQTGLRLGRLEFSTEPVAADAHLIAVPTPVNPDRTADLRYVDCAARAIASVLRRGDLVVVESTVPPGTCDEVVGAAIAQESGLLAGVDYDLAHCPERVIPGRIFIEIVENDRVVGGTTPAATERAAKLYERFVKGHVHRTDAVTAELAKLMENTSRDVNIALANEFAEICRRFRSDPSEAISLANRHPRVNILQPGIGVGGHCIPVDPWFLVQAAPDEANLIRTAREVNLRKTEITGLRIAEFLWRTKAKSVALLGLAYKPEVDDFRESPAVRVVEVVREEWNGSIWVADPYATRLPDPLAILEDVSLGSMIWAIEQADAVVPLVAHREIAAAGAQVIHRREWLDPAGIWRAQKGSLNAAVRAEAV